ncbi:dihydrolipoamide acetyltransferase family protein [Aurantiacibacter sediminis]|uniref:Dihydrolipoamide acetyltransferase component of pyruvate dehydrogenase complex n=1 Tax=Aurantiacibacter sediminis TaxID=2793064 RepID=A0ABS0N6V1_9SPHN|nr:2-oxo acid dehydrogenase subunit E2 [Aurantiacibacter sediminis]MBH5323487.1 2-oxo acid dehydrogenase subunit E2 [Aurantiacibacter sediminis]
MTDILVPTELEGTTATVRNWLKSVGDHVKIDDPLVELETDKVTQEVSATSEGVLVEILLDTDSEAEPGAVLGHLKPTDVKEEVQVGSQPAEQRGAVKKSESQLRESSKARGPAIDPLTALSPSVRKALGEHGLDPAQISGTGRGGRITRADVDKFVASGAAAVPAQSSTEVAEPAPTPASLTARTIPHDNMRLAIARNMANSVQTAPHVTAVFEADLSAIIAHRAANKAAFEAKGVKLTFSAYFVAAAAEAMKVAAAINSRWHDDCLELFENVNIGIGTALGEKGLVVPVIHNTQDLSLRGIARRLTDITERARSNQLGAADMARGTFTISNHGVSGSLLATPVIINQPQSAILGLGKMEKRVVVREIDGQDAMQVRPMCYVSLTIDHRVVDGHQTNAWLTRFVEVIENWAS